MPHCIMFHTSLYTNHTSLTFSKNYSTEISYLHFIGRGISLMKQITIDASHLPCSLVAFQIGFHNSFGNVRNQSLCILKLLDTYLLSFINVYGKMCVTPVTSFLLKNQYTYFILFESVCHADCHGLTRKTKGLTDMYQYKLHLKL